MRLTDLPTEFYIPPRTKVVVVGDYFATDLLGGAELTTEALIQACPLKKVFRVHSHSLSSEFFAENPSGRDLVWVVTNYTHASLDGLQSLVESGARYTFIEYDWKWCELRAPRTCGRNKQGGECTCLSTKQGDVWRLVFSHADRVWWMSDSHRQEYLERSGTTFDPDHHLVQASTWTPQDLDFLTRLREQRAVSTPKYADRVAVLNSSSWIKGTQETVRWCESQGLPHTLVGGQRPQEFLTTLSEFGGLVFRPADRDTCPRVVVEAKLLGLDLFLNDNVMHQTDGWWRDHPTPETLTEWLRESPQRFWNKTLNPDGT